MRHAWVTALVFVVFACGPAHPAPQSGAQWPEADPLFHRDARWLGADGALTVPLDADRTLWLFGDTFVAKTPKNVRTEATMPRNTIAIQHGMDPTTATMEFRWRTAADGTPASYFEENGDRWHWPGHGVRVGDSVFVFLGVIRATPNEGLGFASAGWRIVQLDAATLQVVKYIDPPATQPNDAIPACAVVLQGDTVYAFSPSSTPAHTGWLAKLRTADLLAGTALPDWSKDPVMDDVGPECSVHFEASTNRWIHVASRGFGPSTIAMRAAPALEGPWSPPHDVYTPPESRGPKPFVYAAKAHPELTAPNGDLVVTYATNSFDFGDLFTPDGVLHLGWPRFVRIPRSEPR
jgi:hypothetical protein